MASDKANMAEIEYIKSGGNIKLKDLAKKYNVAPGTVRSWKHRYDWDKKVEQGIETVTNKKILDDINKADLTEKQKLFCLYYTKTYNATEAVIRAGYNVGNSQRAAEIGYQLLHTSPVKKEIDKLKEMKQLSIMLTEEDIVEIYMRIAFADITDFVEFGQEKVPVSDKEGNHIGSAVDNIVNFKDSNIIDGQLVKEIKKGKQGISIKLESKMKALEWLTDYFDMRPDSKHKKAYDNARLQLKRDELELKKEIEQKKNW